MRMPSQFSLCYNPAVVFKIMFILQVYKYDRLYLVLHFYAHLKIIPFHYNCQKKNERSFLKKCRPNLFDQKMFGVKTWNFITFGNF